MPAVSKSFVQFYSPGTLMAEVDEHPVDRWDVDAAVELARSVHQRHGARPYGFQFITRTRGEDDLDSSVTDKSPLYYLGGRVETIEEVEARNDPKERILRLNMRGNGWDRIIVNDNSWRWTQPLRPDDIVLNVTL